MFLTVYLSNNEQHFTEVPVTPETICRDVVDLCKEPGESDCHLAEVWCGSGTSSSAVPSLLSSVLERAVCAFHVYPRRNWRRGCLSERVLSVQFCCLLRSLFFFLIFILTTLGPSATRGIFSCGIPALSCGMWFLAPWPRKQSGPPPPCTGSMESWPLNHLGSSSKVLCCFLFPQHIIDTTVLKVKG